MSVPLSSGGGRISADDAAAKAKAEAEQAAAEAAAKEKAAAEAAAAEAAAKEKAAAEAAARSATAGTADPVVIPNPVPMTASPATIVASLRRSFSTGAQRDNNTGKPRPDLISPFAIERLGYVLAKGAVRYTERNWEKGMPMGTFLESLERHLMQYKQGDKSEDHLGQLCFNVMAMLHGEEMIKRGVWPAEFDNLPRYTPAEKKA